MKPTDDIGDQEPTMREGEGHNDQRDRPAQEGAPGPASSVESALVDDIPEDEVPFFANYLAAVHRLATREKAVIEKLGGTYAIIRQRGLIESYVVVIRNGALSDELLHHFLRTKFGHARVVVLTGGETEAEVKRLKKIKPLMTSSHVGLVHVDDAGAVWAQRAREVEKALTQAALEPPTKAQLDAVLKRSEEQREEVETRQGEARDFVAVLKARKPVATYGLIGLIGIFFAMEFAFGGVESIPVLARMGAHLSSRMTDENEWYRGLSVALLHRGYLHAFFNAYVLFILGSMTERVLGTHRFLILFVAAAAGGSFATFLREDVPLSVGASGAVWGILAAQAILAWFGRGILPDAMLAPARRAATFNLVANIFVSTLPSVDWTAHLGGGLVGAVLVGSGLLTRGLPRAEAAEETTRTPIWIRAAAVVVTLLFLGCGAFALWNGRAWELRSMEQERVHVAGAGYSLLLPTNLYAPPTTRADVETGETSVTFGVPLLDAQAGEVQLRHLPAGAGAADVEALVNESTTALEGLEIPNAKAVGKVQRLTIDGRIAIQQQWAFPTDVTLTKAFLFSPTEAVIVEFVQWPGLQTTTALEIAKSVKPMEKASP